MNFWIFLEFGFLEQNCFYSICWNNVLVTRQSEKGTLLLLYYDFHFEVWRWQIFLLQFEIFFPNLKQTDFEKNWLLFFVWILWAKAVLWRQNTKRLHFFNTWVNFHFNTRKADLIAIQFCFMLAVLMMLFKKWKKMKQTERKNK